MTVINYDWDEVEDNIVAELDDDGNAIAQYTTEPTLYGNVISQYRNGQTSYFHHDGIGNTVAVTNDNGDVTDTRAYNAFGEITESTGTTEFPFQFIGQKGYYRDEETGKYSVRARPYTPVNARWQSVDPFVFWTMLDNYVYSANDPVNITDPSGEFPWILLIPFVIPFLPGCGGGGAGDPCCSLKTPLDIKLTIPEKPDKNGNVACQHINLVSNKNSVEVFGYQFESQVQFKNDLPKSSCRCCRFFQQVKGYQRYRWDTDFKGVYSYVKDSDGKDMNYEDFVEDCIKVDGKKVCYGDRNGENASVAWFVDEYTGPDRKTGCSYRAIDTPGLNLEALKKTKEWNAKRTITYEMNLEFRLSIEDDCCNKTVTSKGFVLKCTAELKKD